jgi:hypothetical protein
VALSDDKATVLMGRMRYPSLSIHGVEGAFSAPGAKTVIVRTFRYVTSMRHSKYYFRAFCEACKRPRYVEVAAHRGRYQADWHRLYQVNFQSDSSQT